MLSMALIVTGGIYIVGATARATSPLGLPVALLAASALLWCGNVVSLARVAGLRRALFFEVAQLGAARLLRDRGHHRVGRSSRTAPAAASLVVLTLSLVVFAVHVPLLIGFTVARYQPLDGRPTSQIDGAAEATV